MMQHLRPEITLRRASGKAKRPATAAARRSGFTLIEIMIALAIFAIMMSIIFVPLNLALKLFHISKTRSDLLAAAQSTMDTMEREMRKAIHVFPNEALPNVTDRAPYTAGGANPAGHPYVAVNASGLGVCDTDTTNAQYVDAPSRIDFLLPNNFYIDPTNPTIWAEQQQPLSPLQPAPYLVSYYPRRLDASATAIPAEPFENPIVLFRAVIPYREHSGTPVLDPMAGTSLNANLSSTINTRYPDPADPTRCAGGAAATNTNRESYWLTQFGSTREPNLEPLCFETTTFAPYAPVPGSHTLLLPRGVTLLARQAYDPMPNGAPNPTPDYTPDTTFHCADTNGDHKIDQVTISLVLSSHDEIGADRRGGQFNAQRQALTHVISLPNVK